MLSSIVSHLSSCRVILASQSPRRLDLLRDCGLTFEVIPSTFEENLSKAAFPSPELYVMKTAKHKALEVLQRTVDHAQGGPYLVIACDTVVVLDGEILEKPTDEEHAFQMLSKLSGKEHSVYSGVALLTKALGADAPHLFFERTAVHFGLLTPEDIRSYIQTGESMDKAGSYASQGKAKCFIQEIHGCHNNVIGFPVQRFRREIEQLVDQGKLY